MRYIQGMAMNGITLRTPGSADAETMIAFMKQIYGETMFLSCTPEEFDVSLEQELEFLRRHERSELDCMIGAWVDGRLAGTVRVAAVSGNYRQRHRAKLGISVLKEFWGRGVGSALMDAALTTASSPDTDRWSWRCAQTTSAACACIRSLILWSTVAAPGPCAAATVNTWMKS